MLCNINRFLVQRKLFILAVIFFFAYAFEIDIFEYWGCGQSPRFKSGIVDYFSVGGIKIASFHRITSVIIFLFWYSIEQFMKHP